MSDYSFEFEGKKIEIRTPTSKDQVEARLFSGGLFRKASENDPPPPARDQLSKHLIKLGLWDDDKEKQLSELSDKLEEGKKQLARGGKTKDGEVFTKEQAKQLSIDMLRWRNEWVSLALELRQWDHITIEGIVEEANFNYLVSCCSYMDGKRIYNSYEDFLEKQNSELAFKCSEALSKKLYGEVDQNKNPEVEFLKKYNYMNDQGRFIDSDGNLVDSKGRRINEDGRYIDENGNFINLRGERVDENGDVIIEFTDYPE